MPDQSALGSSRALKPPPTGRRRRRAWLCTLAVTLAVLLVLTGLEVGVRVLPPDAVQVTASSAASGQTLGTATVTDTATVADWSARINTLPAINLLYNCSPGPNPGAVTVELDFLRWGLPIEAATLPGDGCGAWDVSQGAIPSARDDPNGHTQALLSEVHTLLPTVAWP